MKKVLLSLSLMALLSACGEGVYTVDAHFNFTNSSNKDGMVAVIGGRDAGPVLGPQSADQFDAPIQVSSPSSGTTSPSYQQMSVSISVRAVDGSFISPPISCLAGLRVVTSITYVVYPPAQTGYVYCQSSVSYQVVRNGMATQMDSVVQRDSVGFRLR